MAFTVLLRATAKSGRGQDVVDFYRETLAATRSRPGCIGVRVIRSIDDDTEFALIEQWDTKADQEAYVAWRTETSADVLVRFGELLARPLTIDSFEEINA
ncbi:Quinol monooxygenase YgiN [Klenkia marina]|uniref:Quinol monooxygenase YgiN n=1 Tax=Klenkia marina TaxID=1960309 RepID=A0A1G4XUK9_9ACTN|nr:antibiotic biosynthesis monooxygenase family protein [Klenkia marina]SCX44338.1 Quinol monooxygenase YgiN [Klenkia marina]